MNYREAGNRVHDADGLGDNLLDLVDWNQDQHQFLIAGRNESFPVGSGELEDLIHSGMAPGIEAEEGVFVVQQAPYNALDIAVCVNFSGRGRFPHKALIQNPVDQI